MDDIMIEAFVLLVLSQCYCKNTLYFDWWDKYMWKTKLWPI